MKKYYINTHPLSDGRYVIHEEGCPLLSDAGRRRFLGMFGNRQEALAEAAGFSGIACMCRFCLHERMAPHAEGDREIKGAAVFIKSAAIKPSLKDVMFCPVS
jgi:hypothetical protein